MRIVITSIVRGLRRLRTATLPLAVVLGVGGTLLVSMPASAVVSCSVSSGVTIVGSTVRGTNGADTINCSASTEAVTIFGNGGNDNITGTNDSVGDSLRGGSGNDRVSGLFGDDTLLGEAGNDTLLGGGTVADDFCDGGTGTDTASGCAVRRNIP